MVMDLIPGRSVPVDEKRSAPAAELASRIRAGEAAAFREVKGRVRRIVRFKNLGIPEDHLDDLEQEIVTQIWQAVNRPRFDLEGGFWGFVELVTVRRCIDWMRRARRLAEPLSEALEDFRDGPLGKTLGQERTRIAARALESLDSGCRELIRLRLAGGWSYQELSDRTGRSEGALRVQMYRCIRRAREALESLAGSEMEQ